LLKKCDSLRRAITHNPDPASLDDKIQKAIDASQVIQTGDRPFGSDEIQGQSSGLTSLPFALDGTDPNIKLASQLNLKSPQSVTIVAAIDKAIVDWTRIESRERSKGITKEDSMRMYGNYCGILGWLTMFGGDANRIDVA